MCPGGQGTTKLLEANQGFLGETMTGSDCILEKSFQYNTENKEKGGETAGEMDKEVPAVMLVT